jgi:hypothetical protein
MNKIMRFFAPYMIAFLFLGILIWLVGVSSRVIAAPSISTTEGSILVTTLEYELNSNGDCASREAIQAANTDAEVGTCPVKDAVSPIQIIAQQRVSQNFSLLSDAPTLGYSPEFLVSTQQIGMVTTQTMTLSNTGTLPLEFNLGEEIPGSVLILHLDEPAGSVIFQDSSLMGNDGSCTGDSCPLSGVPGYIGNGVLFDGDNDYIQSSTNEFPLGNSDRTLALWVKMDSEVAWEAFFAGYGKFGEGGQTYHLGAVYRQVIWSQWGSFIIGPSLSLGEWYHIAVTNIGNYVTLYLNGEPFESGIFSFNTPEDTQLYLGRIPGSLGDTRRLNGIIDEVAVFDRALTAEEIREMYQSWIVNSTYLPLVINFNEMHIAPSYFQP